MVRRWPHDLAHERRRARHQPPAHPELQRAAASRPAPGGCSSWSEPAERHIAGGGVESRNQISPVGTADAVEINRHGGGPVPTRHATGRNRRFPPRPGKTDDSRGAVRLGAGFVGVHDEPEPESRRRREGRYGNRPRFRAERPAQHQSALYPAVHEQNVLAGNGERTGDSAAAGGAVLVWAQRPCQGSHDARQAARNSRPDRDPRVQTPTARHANHAPRRPHRRPTPHHPINRGLERVLAVRVLAGFLRVRVQTP
mmetsp:Transcript_2653/g.10173  ORF Transcript_2653/g.10173 Transcript_2653/m.10173 type:complete len:255 (-) Transcript_2653:292-1056(-)